MGQFAELRSEAARLHTHRGKGTDSKSARVWRETERERKGRRETFAPATASLCRAASSSRMCVRA
eukprot:490009-Rhodomonas_salina.1